MAWVFVSRVVFCPSRPCSLPSRQFTRLRRGGGPSRPLCPPLSILLVVSLPNHPCSSVSVRVCPCFSPIINRPSIENRQSSIVNFNVHPVHFVHPVCVRPRPSVPVRACPCHSGLDPESSFPSTLSDPSYASDFLQLPRPFSFQPHFPTADLQYCQG